MAAFITSYTGYIIISFLPPIVWLLFYLREDRHPEPKSLLMLVFMGGMGAALVAVFAELAFLGEPRGPQGLIGYLYPALYQTPLLMFGVIALVEEYAKYAAVHLLVLSKPDFDEPIDAMIYMITSALGFAALENAFFLVPVLRDTPALGLQLAANRFIGANVLHALSSAIVGYFLARALFSPYRKHFVALGIVIGAFLHLMFNYFIIIKEAVPESVDLLILLLLVMAFMVFIDFEKLKKA